MCASTCYLFAFPLTKPSYRDSRLHSQAYVDFAKVKHRKHQAQDGPAAEARYCRGA